MYCFETWFDDPPHVISVRLTTSDVQACQISFDIVVDRTD